MTLIRSWHYGAVQMCNKFVINISRRRATIGMLPPTKYLTLLWPFHLENTMPLVHSFLSWSTLQLRHDWAGMSQTVHVYTEVSTTAIICYKKYLVGDKYSARKNFKRTFTILNMALKRSRDYDATVGCPKDSSFRICNAFPKIPYGSPQSKALNAVSYTHLTLPTILRV